MALDWIWKLVLDIIDLLFFLWWWKWVLSVPGFDQACAQWAVDVDVLEELGELLSPAERKIQLSEVPYAWRGVGEVIPFTGPS